MTRTALPLRDRRAISKRLRSFVSHHYRSRRHFEKELELPHSTMSGWMDPLDPSGIDLPHLMRLARSTRINLHWLLVGEGAELRESRSEVPVEKLHALIEAQLRQSERATDDEFDLAWVGLTLRELGSGEDAILRLATDGVRPRLQEELRFVRRWLGLRRIYKLLERMLKKKKTIDGKAADRILRRFRTLVKPN